MLTPLAIYGFQMEYQWRWWSEADELAFRDYHYLIDWRWQLMELATLLGGTFLLWRYRLPFLTMPIAVTLWYMGMDLAPYLFGPEYDSWLRRTAVSVGSGLLIIGLALTVDIRGRRGHKDYAFWFHLFGALTMWVGLSGLYWDRSIRAAGYLASNLAMITAGALFLRPVFVVFGGLGITTCLIYLAYRDYLFSLEFPFVLTLTLLFLGYTGLAISMWPNIVPPGISIWDAASPPQSLGFALVGALFIIPFILAYTTWSYYVFRGKVKAGEGYH